MPRLTIQDGKLLLRDGKPGTEASCCCGPTCGCSSAGTSPAIPSDVSKGLAWLEFSSCIGSGAAGTVDAPAAASPCDYEGLAGAITGATLTSGGSGYARLGRVAPTVTASAAGGTGATLSVTLSQQTDSLNGCLSVPIWSVGSVSVTSAGTGYSDFAAVTFSTSDGVTQAAASGQARIAYAEPQNVVVTIYDWWDEPPGTPYPGVPASGTGAVLEPIWELLPENQWPAPHQKTYRLSGMNVVNGGSGYKDYAIVQLSFASSTDGINQSSAVPADDALYIDCDIVATGGVIQQVYVYEWQDYFTPTPAGKFVGRPTTGLHSVSVSSAGQYYKEDASQPPYVADVTVTVQQESPSAGSGAVVTAAVEDDTASPDFGKVSALTLVDGGAGYLNAPLACDLPDTLHIAWGAFSADVPMKVPFQYLNWWAGDSYLVAPWSFPTSWVGDQPAPTGICVPSNNCCANQNGPTGPIQITSAGAAESEWGEWMFQSFSIASGVISSPFSTGEISPLACRCAQHLHIRLVMQSECIQYIPIRTYSAEFPGTTFYSFSYRTLKRKLHTFCLRFDKDENGCPVGDAQIISRSSEVIEDFTVDCPAVDDWYGDPVTDCSCNEDCFNEIEPVVSFMP